MKLLIVLSCAVALAAAKPTILTYAVQALPASIAIAPPAGPLPQAPEPVQDTAEVAAARASHLAAVEEARSKSAAPAPAPAAPAPAPAPAAPEPVQDTPEVAAARAQHLAAVETAKAKALNPPEPIPTVNIAAPAVIAASSVVAAPRVIASPGLIAAPGLISAPGLLSAPGIIAAPSWSGLLAAPQAPIIIA